MPKARITMIASKAILCIMLIPNNGKKEKNKGNTAQWIAQAMEVEIPKTSQLTFEGIRLRKYKKATMLQNC
jgi:hypothetical protein